MIPKHTENTNNTSDQRVNVGDQSAIIVKEEVDKCHKAKKSLGARGIGPTHVYIRMDYNKISFKMTLQCEHDDREQKSLRSFSFPPPSSPDSDEEFAL